MKHFAKPLYVLIASFLLATAAQAQSTVGELLEKGGRRITKDETQALFPFRMKWQWPNRQGEEELLLSQDGKITGSGYHFFSKTTSPAEGTWKLEEDGKLCAAKKFTEWATSTNMCWYGFELGKDFFASAKSEPDSKLLKIGSITKVAVENK